MAQFIASAWLVTVIVTVYLAAWRGIPVFNAFGWINSWPGFYLSLAVLAIVCGLAFLELTSDRLVLNQLPMTWAALVMLVYAWLSIIYRLRKA